jgi:putative restriction endonuclease
MAFYWVNVGTSFKEVETYSFLWAPAYTLNKNNTKIVNAGWKHVPNVKEGDIVFCYTQGRLIYCGKAKADAYAAPRPSNRSFKEWVSEGFKVEIDLQVLTVPIQTEDFSADFVALYNHKTKPKLFASNGVPSQQYMVSMPDSAGVFLLDLIDDFNFSLDTETDNQTTSTKSVKKTTQETLVKARVGQGKFRKEVLDLWDAKCPITNTAIVPLLVASHIQPWQLSSDAERLDPYNGLPLSPNIDKLFDKGLISFNDVGELIYRGDFDVQELRNLGVPENAQLNKVYDKNLKYLREHRRLHDFK